MLINIRAAFRVSLRVVTAYTYTLYLSLSVHFCACRQHQHGTPEADMPKAQPAEQHQQQPGPLLELYPGSSPAYLNHVLHDICHDRLEVCGLTPATVHLSDQCCLLAHQAQSQACRLQMCTSHLMFCGSFLASFPQHWVSLILRLLQDAAHWLMDQDSLERSEASWHARQEQLQRDAEQAARQEKASRKQLLDKYHLQAVPTSAYADVHTRTTQAPKSKVLLICHRHATSLSRSKLLSATKGFSQARCTALWLVTEPK